jgi:CRISPR-associated protein Cmr3
MNTILLEPTDVLFFRDGRPMGGSSSGHGAAWPMPNVINHAFHAALHRAELQGVHEHRRGRSGDYSETRDRKFGSLVTAGPFPVCTNGEDHTWFFARPADSDDSGHPILLPFRAADSSSLAGPCRYPVVSSKPPTKETSKPWWNEGAWNSYLGTTQRNDPAGRSFRKYDGDFSDTEHAYGIGIDPERGSVEEGRFYSAHYLRLREGWKLGVLATAPDKSFQNESHGSDLVKVLLNAKGCEILAGGQQRVCTATLDPLSGGRLPLPLGMSAAFHRDPESGKYLVKWVLLSPAVFPAITQGLSKRGTERKAHPGGWLPTWICPESGAVLLQTIDETERKRRRSLNASGKGYASVPDIDARLVAAIVGKPIPVTGYALPHEAAGRDDGGAKPIHPAVPAGSVYYFECETEDSARKLAIALNWHGETPGNAIHNRRSTLMGEKGFGIGVCGTWQFHCSQGL